MSQKATDPALNLVSLVVEIPFDCLEYWHHFKTLLLLKRNGNVDPELSLRQIELEWFLVKNENVFADYEDKAIESFRNFSTSGVLEKFSQINNIVFHLKLPNSKFDNAHILEFVSVRELMPDLMPTLNIGCEELNERELKSVEYRISHLMSDYLGRERRGKKGSVLGEAVVLQEAKGELRVVRKFSEERVYKKLLPIFKINKDIYVNLFRSHGRNNTDVKGLSNTSERLRNSVRKWYDGLEEKDPNKGEESSRIKNNIVWIRRQFQNEPVFLEFLFQWFLHYMICSHEHISSIGVFTKKWVMRFGAMEKKEFVEASSLSKRYFVGLCELIENAIYHTEIGTCFLLLELLENPFGPHSVRKFRPANNSNTATLDWLKEKGFAVACKTGKEGGKHSKYYIIHKFLKTDVTHSKELQTIQSQLKDSGLLSLQTYDDHTRECYERYLETTVSNNLISGYNIFLRSLLVDTNKLGISETFEEKINTQSDEKPTLENFFHSNDYVIAENMRMTFKNIAHLGLAVFTNIFRERGFVCVTSGFNEREQIILSPNSTLEYRKGEDVRGVGTCFELIIPLGHDLVETIPEAVPADTGNYLRKFAKILSGAHYADLREVSSVLVSEIINCSNLVSRQNEQDAVKKGAECAKEKWDRPSKAIAFDCQGAASTMCLSIILKIVGLLQVNPDIKVKNYIIFYNLPSNLIPTFYEYIKAMQAAPRFWNEIIWVYVYNEKGFPLIIGGGSYEEFTRINSLAQAYYGNSFGIVETTGEGSNADMTELPALVLDDSDDQLLLSKNSIIPFEVLIHDHKDSVNSYPVFEGTCFEFLKAEGGNLTKKESHVRIGSKIHVSNYVSAVYFFKNRFFTQRFAYLLAKEIIESVNIRREGSEVKLVLLSYGSFSRSLIQGVFLILDEYHKSHKPDHWVISPHYFVCNELPDEISWHDDRHLRDLSEGAIEDLRFAIIVPIASTLTTNWKVFLSWAQQMKTYLDDKLELEEIRDQVVFNSSVILLRNSQSVACTDMEKSFGWTRKLDHDDKQFNTALFPNKPIRYFYSTETDWVNPLECELCFPPIEDDDLKPLLSEKILLEVNPDLVEPTIKSARVRIVDIPKSKTQKFSQFISRFFAFDGSADIFSLIHNLVAPDEGAPPKGEFFLRVGHCLRNSNHYRYYVETVELMHSRLEQIKLWLSDSRKNLEISSPFKWGIVYPVHETNIDFVNLVNDVFFCGYAEPIPFMRDCDIELQYKTSPKPLNWEGEGKRKYIFVDDAILTGNTLRQAKEFIKKISPGNFKFEKVIVLIQHVNNENLKLQDLDSFIAMHSHASAVFDCSICQRLEELEELHNSLRLDRIKDFTRDEINRYGIKDIRNVELATRWDFSLLLMEEYMWDCLVKLGDDEPEKRAVGFLEILHEISSNEKIVGRERKFTYIFLLKAIANLRLLDHEKLATPVMEFHLEILGKLIKDDQYFVKDDAYLNFFLLIQLMKNLAHMRSTSLLRKTIIHRIWKLYLSFRNQYSDIFIDPNKFHEERPAILHQIFNSTAEIYREEGLELSKQYFVTKNKDLNEWIKKYYLQEQFLDDAHVAIELLQTIMHFRYFYAQLVKQIVFQNESRSLWLDYLLRTGREYRVGLRSEDDIVFPGLSNSFQDFKDENSKDFERFVNMTYIENNTTLSRLFNKKIPVKLFRNSIVEDLITQNKCEGVPSQNQTHNPVKFLDGKMSLDDAINTFGDVKRWSKDVCVSPYYANYKKLIAYSENELTGFLESFEKSLLHKKVQLLLILRGFLRRVNSDDKNSIPLALETRFLLSCIRLLFDSDQAVLYISDRQTEKRLFKLASVGEEEDEKFPNPLSTSQEQSLRGLLEFAFPYNPFTYKFVSPTDTDEPVGVAIKFHSNVRPVQSGRPSLGIFYIAFDEKRRTPSMKTTCKQDIRLFLIIKEEIERFLRRNIDNESMGSMVEEHLLSQLLIKRFKNHQHDIEGRSSDLSSGLVRTYNIFLQKGELSEEESIEKERMEENIFNAMFMEANLKIGYFFWRYLIAHEKYANSDTASWNLKEKHNDSPVYMNELRDTFIPIILYFRRSSEVPNVIVDFPPENLSRQIRPHFQSIVSFIFLLILNAKKHWSEIDGTQVKLYISVQGNDLVISSENTKRPENMNELKERVSGPSTPEDGITLFTIDKYITYQGFKDPEIMFNIEWTTKNRFETRFINALWGVKGKWGKLS